MEEREINTYLKDQQEINGTVNGRLEKLENRKIEIPDHSDKLDEIAGAIGQITKICIPKEKADMLIDRMDGLAKAIPREIHVRNHYQFSDKSRGFIIGTIILLCMVAVSVGAVFHLWQRNGELQGQSIRYRMLRQYYPVAAAWAERTYMANPDSALRDVEQRESHEERLRLAEKEAEIKEKDAREARGRADSLKGPPTKAKPI